MEERIRKNNKLQGLVDAITIVHDTVKEIRKQNYGYTEEYYVSLIRIYRMFMSFFFPLLIV